MHMATWPGWNSIEGASAFSRWFAIAGFVVFFLLVVLEVLHFVYSEHKDTLIAEAELQTKREREQQEQSANAERDAQVAEARREAREAQQALQRDKQQRAPRHLTETQKHSIASFLRTKPRGAFTIHENATVDDASAYAEEIATLFNNVIGWPVTI